MIGALLESIKQEQESLKRACAQQKAHRAGERAMAAARLPGQFNLRIRFIMDACHKPGAACILWPFKTNKGYGTYSNRAAHCVALELYTNTSQPKGKDGAHSCGNRACINPRHIEWKTRKANNLDKRKHGTWGHKLTPGDVLAIRASKSRAVVLAAEYGVHQSTIRSIRARTTWGWVEDAHPPLNYWRG